MIYSINNKNSIQLASSKLLNGEIIIYPTDTLYGFGVDATNCKAIDKLNKLKKRTKVYSIIVSSIKMLNKYAKVTKDQERELKKYLPGPFTMILKKNKSNLSNLITLDLRTIGIRIPKNQFILKLVSYIDKPIVTTSVNIHKSNFINDVNRINQKFNDIDIFYDDSVPKKSLGSTIIDLTSKSTKILRQGDGIY